MPAYTCAVADCMPAVWREKKKHPSMDNIKEVVTPKINTTPPLTRGGSNSAARFRSRSPRRFGRSRSRSPRRSRSRSPRYDDYRRRSDSPDFRRRSRSRS